MSGENMSIFMTVKAEVDTGSIEKQLAKIKKDASVQKKIKEQQAQIKELERRFLELQKQLGKADSSKALTLRKESKEIYQEIDDIEAKYKNVINNLEALDYAKATVKLAKRVLNYVEIGMSEKEVKYILGEPTSGFPTELTYGRFEIRLDNDIELPLVYEISFAIRPFGNHQRAYYVVKNEQYNILKHGYNRRYLFRTPSLTLELERDEELVKKYILGE